LRSRNTNTRRPLIDPLAAKFKKNELISALEVRLIDENGEPLGVVSTSKALEMAKEADLDLVEVAPAAIPPVAKIISWSKFKYDHSKKSKSNTSKSQMKEVRFGAMIGENDRVHKTKRIKEFLMDKHLVKVTVRTPGRIKIDQSKNVMNKVIYDTYEFGELEGGVKIEGQSVTATLKPLKVKRIRPVEDETSES
jgi:translation initiation factor IF-3